MICYKCVEVGCADIPCCFCYGDDDMDTTPVCPNAFDDAHFVEVEKEEIINILKEEI